MRMWNSFIIVGLIAVLLFTGFSIISSSETNEQKEGTYLPIANNIIASEVQDIEQYGSFYIDRSDGRMKFVLALAKEDAKTERLKERMIKELPEDLLVVKTDYRYPVVELKKVMAEITLQMSKLQTPENDVVSVYLDEPTGSVVVEARSLTNEWITEWKNKYQDKVTVHIDPKLQNSRKISD